MSSNGVPMAAVEQSAPSKPPTLTPGDISPAVARNWDMACRTYFMHKRINAEDQVKMIAFGMLDPRLQNWYITNSEQLDVLSFPDYLKEFKSTWLETHWDVKIRRKLLSSKQSSRSFYEWAIDLQTQNALLHGSPSFLSDEQLLHQLEANMNDDLSTDVLHANMEGEPTLKGWIEWVKRLDDKRREQSSRQLRIAEEAIKSNRRVKDITNTSYKPRYNVSSSSVATSASSSTTPATPRLPPLTQAERDLLAQNKGCFKCRKLFVDHRAKDCKDDAPDPATYKTITAAIVAAAK
ncbi:hypothetical protein BJ138DRAFT_1019457, partial [Hygrophoropsis aurantiaca]